MAGGKTLPGVVLEDSSRVTSLVALQGPASREILQPLCSGPLEGLKRFGFAAGEVAGVPCLVSRTGYTGEDGFELFTQGDAVHLWQERASNIEEGSVRQASNGCERDFFNLGRCQTG